MNEEKGIHLEMLRIAIQQAINETEKNVKAQMDMELAYYRRLCMTLLVLLSVVSSAVLILAAQLVVMS
jgi:hypothetical protein